MSGEMANFARQLERKLMVEEAKVTLLRNALHRANVAVAHSIMTGTKVTITPELQAFLQAALDATA